MIGRLLVAMAGLAICAGCANQARTRDALPTSQPSTAQAASEHAVASNDFDHLWRACEDIARDRLFTIERRDYRGGVLTTAPMISAQFFEPWRRDAITSDAINESSLASIRRTLRFEFTRHDDGTFSVVPRVLVERYSLTERRMTSAMMYRSAFKKVTATGTRETDRGVYLPGRYWYGIGNDAALEQDLAKSIRARL